MLDIGEAPMADHRNANCTSCVHRKDEPTSKHCCNCIHNAVNNYEADSSFEVDNCSYCKYDMVKDCETPCKECIAGESRWEKKNENS